MTAGNTFYAKNAAFNRAMRADRVDSIRRTARVKPASTPDERTDAPLVNLNRHDDQRSQKTCDASHHSADANFFANFCQITSRSARNSALDLSATPYRAKKITSVGTGRGCSRKYSLTTRFTRFLWFARLTFFFATMTPRRDSVSEDGTTSAVPEETPALLGCPSKTALKACLSRSLWCFRNEKLMGGVPIKHYADRRRRPRARRRAKTFRPFLVAMRARKPWLRLRFRTLG